MPRTVAGCNYRWDIALLDLSKIEAGKLQLEEQDFSLLALLDNVTSMVSSAAAAKGLHIFVDAQTTPT